MKKLLSGLAALVLMGAAGCHTCDVCDDCGDPAPVHHAAAHGGCSSCGANRHVRPAPATPAPQLAGRAKSAVR